MTSRIILVVEDDASQREGLAVILREHGYTALTVDNADDGLALMNAEPSPSLVLLDMMIRRGRDGWHFLAERKRSLAASTPVLIITGLGSASEAWARSLDANGLLRKPLETETVLAEIKRWLAA